MKVSREDKYAVAAVMAGLCMVATIAAKVSTPPLPTKGLGGINVKRLDMSVAAGRSVIAKKDIAAFVDPSVSISQHFTKVQDLGSGAFGSVGLFKNEEGKQFAIKHLFCTDSDTVNEFVTGLKLDHPNIVKIHNMVSKTDGHYIIMEYIDGKRMDLTGITHSERLELLKEMLLGYEHALNQGIIPNDLWRNNLLITKDLHWKFVDLGLYQDGTRPGLYPTYFEQLATLVRRLSKSPDGASVVEIKLSVAAWAHRLQPHYRHQWTSTHFEHLKKFISKIRDIVDQNSSTAAASSLFHSRS